MSTRPSYQITPHPLGSLKEIWTLSWPLILGFTSNGLMVFVDRVMLGRYSLKAMNASATAGSAAFSFLILPMIIAGISEVFVGRFNGKAEYQKIGSAVWQMIWFSVLMTPLFVLIANYAPAFLFKKMQSPELNGEYFYWLMCFGSFFCLTKALMGFYIGLGRVKMISLGVVIANVLNIGLDYLLIFGTPFTPSLGIKGAAIATLSTEAMMFLILFLIFMRKKNRESKGTQNLSFNRSLMWTSLKDGLPASLAHLSEYVGYYVFLSWINHLSEEYLTIMVLVQSFYMLLFFIIEGVSKGITGVVSNFIGAQKFEYIPKSIKSTFKLHLCFVFAVSLFMYFCSPGFFKSFVNEAGLAYFNDPLFLAKLHKAALCLCAFYLFDGMAWNFVGVLVAAADRTFVMVVGSLASWAFSYVPAYIGITYFKLDVDQVWFNLVLSSAAFLTLYWLRYRSAPWKKAALAQSPTESI